MAHDHLYWEDADEYRHMTVFNHILGAINLLIFGLASLTLFLSLTQKDNPNSAFSQLGIFPIAISIFMIVITFLGLYNWYRIYTIQDRDLSSILNYLILGAVLDIPLIFAIGLGFIILFVRIVVYSAIYNEYESTVDDDDEDGDRDFIPLI